MEEQETSSVLAAVRAGSLPHLLAVARGDPPEKDLTEGLKEAVLLGLEDAARILLAAGADPHPPDTPLLVMAVKQRNLNMLKILLIEGCEPDHDLAGSALHIAVSMVDQAMVQMLLTGEAACDRQDEMGMTALMHAAATGDVHILKMLLKHTEINNKGGQGRSALHIAVITNNTSMIQCLLELGSDVNLTDDKGFSSLLLACNMGHLDAVKVLLFSPNVDKNISSSAGQGCLHLLLGNNQIDLVDILCEANANCNVRDVTGNSPIAAYSLAGREDLSIRLLNRKLSFPVLPTATSEISNVDKDINVTPTLTAGVSIQQPNNAMQNVADIPDEIVRTSNIDVFSQGEDGRTVLHWAASNAQITLLNMLLSAAPNLQHIKDINNDIPITISAQKKHDDVTKILVASGSDVMHKGSHGMCVLHWLAHHGTLDMLLDSLSSPGSSINIRDSKSRSPLFLAIFNHQYDMARVLLDKWQPDLQPAPGESTTALHVLSRRGHSELVDTFLERGVSPDIKDYNGDYPITLAVSKGHTNTTKSLIGSGADVNVTNAAGNTPLHLAVERGDIHLVRELQQAKSNVNVQNSAGDTPLTLAAHEGHLDIVTQLVEIGCDVNKLGKDGCLALLSPSRAGHLEIVQVLLNAGSLTELNLQKKKKRSQDGKTTIKTTSPLIEAVKRGHEDIVRQLLSHGAAVDWEDSGQGTALLWGAQKGKLNIVKQLLITGADSTHSDDNDDTALTLAAWHKQEALIDLLAPICDIDHAEHEEGMSALHLAISKDHLGCVKRLLANGASINARDKRGNHALLSAAMFTTGPEIIQAILTSDQECDINLQGHIGRTALHWSVNDTATVQLLLQGKPQLDLVDDNGATPLLLSIAHSQPLTSKVLIEAGCDIHKVHQDGRQAVHHAAIYAESQTLEELLVHGVTPEVTTKEGHTPLLLTSIEGHLKCVDILLSHGCLNINTVYFEAITALSVATANKHYSVVLRLLHAGADPNTIGDLRLRPLLSCVINGDMAGVALLLQGGASITQDIEEEHENTLEEGKEESYTGAAGVTSHPIMAAMLRSHFDIASLLASLECKVSKLQTLMKEPVMTLFERDDDTMVMLRALCGVPSPLMALSRHAIRQQLTPTVLSGLHRLPLPAVLREYVRMSNLDCFYMEKLT